MTIPTYRYRVTVGDEEMAFCAVSGLDMSFETVEYKDGTGDVYRMPDQKRVVNLSLKMGVVQSGPIYDWISSAQHKVETRDISVSLTNGADNELLVTWNIINAIPTKLTISSIESSSNEIGIEELSLVADSVTIQFQ